MASMPLSDQFQHRGTGVGPVRPPRFHVLGRNPTKALQAALALFRGRGSVQPVTDEVSLAHLAPSLVGTGIKLNVTLLERLALRSAPFWVSLPALSPRAPCIWLQAGAYAWLFPRPRRERRNARTQTLPEV